VKPCILRKLNTAGKGRILVAGCFCIDHFIDTRRSRNYRYDLLEDLNERCQVASTRQFIEDVGKLLAYLLFDLAAIIYLYVKGLLQDEYVTTLE